MHCAFKEAIMIRPTGGGYAVPWRFRGGGLQQFLQFTFGVFQFRNRRKFAKDGLELAENKIAGRVIAAIEQDGAEQGFIGVSQGRGPLAAAMQVFPPADDQILAKVQLPGALGCYGD